MPDVTPDNYALIAHPTESRGLVLIGAAGDTWALPPLTADAPPEIAAALRHTLGLEATVLERLWERRPPPHLQGHSWPPPGEPAHRIYAVEPLPSPDSWQPPDTARWVTAGELVGLRAVNHEHAEPVAAWLDERAHGIPPLRAPWAIPGWRDEALAWAVEACGRTGKRVVGAPQQIKVSSWSTVWRVPIADGQVYYFKAAHPGQAYEAPLSHLLAERLTPRVPAVVALEADRGWLLMEDGGRSLRDRAFAARTPELAAAYLPEFARLQRAATPHVNKLLAAGCPDFRLARLPDRFARLVADPEMLMVSVPGGMPKDELAQLTAMASGEVAALCAHLAAYGIPETLHHDDLGPGNVLEGPSGFVSFDWAESAVTHPFCSLMIPLRWAAIVQECDGDALDTLRDAYLAPWADYGSPADLRAALGLAHRFGYLCRALTYADLLAAMEPRVRWEFADAPAYWLRLFLRDAPPGGDVPDMG